MEFKEISFCDKNAYRIYLDYIKRVRHSTRPLSKQNQLEILLEINSHIYEGVNDNKDEEPNELVRLLDVLEKLGQPEQFLKPLVAEKKLEEATTTFNPLKVAKALVLNIGNGISYIIFAILYLLLFGFIFLIIAKICNPDQVGLFYKPHEIFILGKYRNNDGVIYSQYELLGNWFIPVIIGVTILLYLLITLLLRLKRTIKKK